MEDSTAGKKLGLWTSTSLVVGNMVGAGIFLLPATLATYGSISLLGWLFSTIGAFLLAKVFSRLGRLMPAGDGGPYAYSREGLGDFAGFLVAWGYWLSVWCTNATIAVSLVSALSTFFPVLSTSAAPAIFTGLACIWLLTWINTRGIIVSGRVQLITTILKLLPIVFVTMIGLFYFNPSHFRPFNTGNMTDVSALMETAVLTFYAYLGIECATIPASNVRDAQKTVPRATMLGFTIAMLVYVGSTISVMGILPPEVLRQSVTPFSDAAGMITGNASRYLVSAGMAIAAFGALNGWILIQGQVPHAIARDNLFPSVFGKENGKGVPAAGIIISSIFCSILMIMNYSKNLADQFKIFVLLATMTTLVPYLFSAASLAILQHRKKQSHARTRLAGFILPCAAFCFTVWALAGSGKDIVFWGFLMLLAGIPFYVWMKVRKPINNLKSAP